MYRPPDARASQQAAAALVLHFYLHADMRGLLDGVAVRPALGVVNCGADGVACHVHFWVLACASEVGALEEGDEDEVEGCAVTRAP